MPHEYVVLAPRIFGLREVAHAVAATAPGLEHWMERGGLQIVLADGDDPVATIVHPVAALPSELGRLLALAAPDDAGIRWWSDVCVPWGREATAERVLASLAAVVGGTVRDLAPGGRG